MTTINTKLHGIIDYTLGILLMFSPWLFNYSRGAIETRIPLIAGALSILYTLFTNCEFGVIKKIRLSNHFLLDLIMGSFLVAAPKLFHYNGYVFMLPYLWIGLIKIFVSLSAGNIMHSKHIEEKNSQAKLAAQLKNILSPLQHFLHSFHKSTANESKSIV